MTNFFAKNRPKSYRNDGLSDATNQNHWNKGGGESVARRLLCCASVGGGARNHVLSPSLEYTVPLDQKTISPIQDVALAWMEMAKDPVVGTSSSSSSTMSSTRSTSSLVTTQDRTRQSYCGSRRMAPTTNPAPRPRLTFSSVPSSSSKRRGSAKKASVGSMSTDEWKSAVDPKSGRTYYYNVKTRETQWRKPIALATPTERAEMVAKERKQKEFFAAMERNILSSIAQGQIIPGTPQATTIEEKKMPSRPHKADVMIEKPKMVRTISGMDDAILKELVSRVPSMRLTTLPLKSSQMDREESLGLEDLSLIHDDQHLSESIGGLGVSSMEVALQDLNFNLDDSPSAQEENRALEELAKAAEQMTRVSGSRVASTEDTKTTTEPKSDLRQTMPPKLILDRPKLENRRNTCGTIYVRTTMSAPDKDATIKCVCGVYRAHILSSAKEESRPTLRLGRSGDYKYRIFNDKEVDRVRAGTVREDSVMEDDSFGARCVPTLDEITNFYRDVFRRAQMESDCMIMSLIYVERLIKCTDGGLRPRPSNWRSLLFSCMVLSSKVWDDLSMWNADFSQTCPSGVQFSLQRINELELAVLNALNYKVKVPASEYAKYYFLLRSMLIKSGLGSEDLKTMNPLDVEGAKKLEQVSSGFQETVATKRRVAQEARLRSKSMGHVDTDKVYGSQTTQDKKAQLEHMVKM